MAKPPHRPRPATRAADLPVASVAGPRFRRRDVRQPDLFRPAPAFIPPCKPELRDRVPTGAAWRFEIKWDGYRIQAHAAAGETGGSALFEATCRMGLEGVVAKRRDRPYRSGERDEWVKVKCRTSECFAVIGFDPRGRRGVASLKIARLVYGELRLCGSVGSGIGEAASRALRMALDAGEPVVIEADHGGVTPAGELRAAVFRGLATEDDG